MGRLRLQVGGAGLMAINTVLSLLDVYDMTASSTARWRLFTTLSFIAFVGFVGWLLRDQHARIEYLEDQKRPVFEFSDTEAACSQIGDNDQLGLHQMRRIVVRNGGGSSVDGVRVSLVNLRPDSAQRLTEKMPLPLKPQHMINASPEYTFSLAPGERRPIDVFALAEKFPGKFILFHAVTWTDSLIPWGLSGSYLIDVQAVGRDVPPKTCVAKIAIENSQPSLRIVESRP